jgi:hypothetical protein
VLINKDVLTFEGNPAESLALLETEALLSTPRLRSRRLLQTQKPLVPGTAPSKDKLGSMAKSITVSGRLNVTGTIVSSPAGDMTANDVKQWKMVFHESFHKGAVEGWKRKSTGAGGDTTPVTADSDVSTCAKFKHEFSDYFLGAFGGTLATKTFTLPPHTMVRVQARVHFIDKWGGELVYMEVDGGRKWSESHTWCSQLFESNCQPIAGKTIDSCGDSNFPGTPFILQLARIVIVCVRAASCCVTAAHVFPSCLSCRQAVCPSGCVVSACGRRNWGQPVFIKGRIVVGFCPRSLGTMMLVVYFFLEQPLHCKAFYALVSTCMHVGSVDRTVMCLSHALDTLSSCPRLFAFRLHSVVISTALARVPATKTARE